MFVRKKRNKSGSTSVQIIDKSVGYKVFQTVGSATEEVEILRLVQKAKKITVVFYDMTTLDGKFQKPQIMLGLLVGQYGYPIGYDIFEGNVFEGKTLIPTLAKISKKFGFDDPIVVADAALLSEVIINF